MRLPRVVASATLIMALALVVVPGSVGSRTPSADLAIDSALLQPVRAGGVLGVTTAATTTLDPAYRSNGALDASEPLIEPAVAFVPPKRAAISSPKAPVRVVKIVKPKPKPAAKAPARSSAPASGSSSSADTSGGGWRYDGHVSWYGPGFYGNRTACGFTLTKGIMGVAHKTLPCGTMVSFRHNGRVITVPVIDRGPYIAGRQWDLTGGACTALGHCFTGGLYWRFP